MNSRTPLISRKSFNVAALMCGAGLAVSVLNVQAGDFTFSTGDFSTWTSVQAVAPLPESMVTIENSGGNPGGYIRSRTTADEEQISFAHDTSGAFTFHPAGIELRALDSFVDMLGLSPLSSDPDQNPLVALGATQNGEIFYDIFTGTGMDETVTNWTTWSLAVEESTTLKDSLINLKALVDPSYAGPFNLDFSAGAPPITFGLLFDGDVNGRDVGYDNVLLSFATVPDSGSTATLVLLAGLTMPLSRRLFGNGQAAKA